MNPQYAIGDTVKPKSLVVDLKEYEKAMDAGYVLRVWRVKGASRDEKEFASYFWCTHCLGIPYDQIGMLRCWVFRFVNSLPYEIRTRGQWTWCTKNTVRPWSHTAHDVSLKPDGRLKKNTTPRTMENRLVQGVLEDISDHVLFRNRFILEHLEPGLILAGRNPTGRLQRAIRAILGSYTNHNALIIDKAHLPPPAP